MPTQDKDGKPTYNYRSSDWHEKYRAGRKSAQFIPLSLLLDQGLYEEARSCAVAYNDALAVYRNCSAWAGWLRLGQLLGAGGTVLAAGVGPNTSNDVVKRHWTYASLGSAGVLAFFTGFDLWLNCNERTVEQQALASQRLAALHNAGHLATCSQRLREQVLVVETIKVKLRDLKTKDAAGGPNVDKALGALEKKELAFADLADAALGLKEAVPDLGATKAKEQAELKLKREELAKDVEKLVELKASLCREIKLGADGKPTVLQDDEYFDLAHQQLVRCLEPGAILFNSQAAVGVSR